MDEGKADDRKYARAKPSECRYCYFWNEKKECCERSECYYLLSDEEAGSGEALADAEQPESEAWECEGCPYGIHYPCIGYCLRKILLEMKQKKQKGGREVKWKERQQR